MTEDVTDFTVPLKLKTIRYIVVSTAVITATIGTAWYTTSQKADAAMTVAIRAEASGARAEASGERQECLMQQLIDYLIYKKNPSMSSCEKKRKGYE